MKLPVSPRAAALLAGPLVALLARSWRVETSGEERWRSSAAMCVEPAMHSIASCAAWKAGWS